MTTANLKYGIDQKVIVVRKCEHFQIEDGEHNYAIENRLVGTIADLDHGDWLPYRVKFDATDEIKANISSCYIWASENQLELVGSDNKPIKAEEPEVWKKDEPKTAGDAW